jgi:hypothetical protein
VYVGLVDGARELPLESLGLVALVSYTGFKDWKWGSASFRFNSEGWFGMDTRSGGIDKVGHAYGAYMSSELLYWRLRSKRDDRWVISLYPAVFASFLYQYVEFFDGFSVDHGYAYEDSIADTLGVLLSLARNTFPGLRRAFDFRLEYYPTKGLTPRPMIDYEGQKFFGVVKLAGLPGLERTPLRFAEILMGYYTRGFSKASDAPEKRSNLVLGIGVSLEQVLFVPLQQTFGSPFGFLRLSSHYLEPPLYSTLEATSRAPR